VSSQKFCLTQYRRKIPVELEMFEPQKQNLLPEKAYNEEKLLSGNKIK
jgi:hypothetical protein